MSLAFTVERKWRRAGEFAGFPEIREWGAWRRQGSIRRYIGLDVKISITSGRTHLYRVSGLRPSSVADRAVIALMCEEVPKIRVANRSVSLRRIRRPRSFARRESDSV
jgi:hypothetical protein